MGKATIISHIADGEYSIQLTLLRDRFDATIVDLNAQISILTTLINSLPDGEEKNLATLRRTALQKRIVYMNANMPPDSTITAWCSDLTTDLTGTVGTIEIPGERGSVVIQPGFGGNAVYDSARDGQLGPSLNNTFEGLAYNLMMLPGWQKWKPTYRFGTISNLVGDVCDVTLDAAISSQQSLNVNQASVLTGVTIDYMGQGGNIFTDGDEVVVKFVAQDFAQPLVIGFKDNPLPVASGSIDFDGIDSYLSMPANSVWARGTGPFTLDLFLKIKMV